MIHILLSIRRPFSEQILSGMKKSELRKTFPHLWYSRGSEGVTLWLYESGKDGQRLIIGTCHLDSIWSVEPAHSDALMQEVATAACVTVEFARRYSPCNEWRVINPRKLSSGIPLSIIHVSRPPQSWQYLRDDQVAILNRSTKTCEECLYWDGFDGCCISTQSGHWFQEVPAYTPACQKFRPEEVFPPDEEIEQGESNENDA